MTTFLMVVKNFSLSQSGRSKKKRGGARDKGEECFKIPLKSESERMET
jgi:hypothetical protein